MIETKIDFFLPILNYLNVCFTCNFCKIFINISFQNYLILRKIPGPFGEQDEEQVFVQKVVPETSELYVRLASNGKRFV